MAVAAENKPTTPLIITPEQAAAELLKRREIKRSLHNFVKESWHVWEGKRAFRDSWTVGAICEHAQAVVNGHIENLLINQPPRTGKSTICGVCLVPWIWTEAPEWQVLCASYDSNLSQRDHRTARQLMLSNWYQVRWGDSFKFAEDQNTKVRYNNDKGGYRIATAVDGSTTGDGGSLIVVDDPNNAKDSSDAALENTLYWWRTVMPTRINDLLNVKRIVVQQRLHEKDLSGEILANNSDHRWVHLRLPLEYEKENPCITVALPATNARRWRDPRTKEGETLDPAYFTPKVVASLKAELGSEYNISGQLQQRPSPGEGGIIKRRWFRLWPEKDENGDYPGDAPPRIEYTIMSIDTSLTDVKGSGYNAATTWGIFRDKHDIGNAILLSTWRLRCEWPEMRKRILRMADDYLDDGPSPLLKRTTTRKPDQIIVENQGFGKLLIRDLARANKMVMAFNPQGKGDKVQRLRIISPLLEAGRVWVPAKAPDYKLPRPWAEEFIAQVISFPKAASRDLVDTMTQALYRLQMSGWIWNPGDAASDLRAAAAPPPRPEAHMY